MPEEKGHQHRGKFTEGLLDSELILKSLNIEPGQIILDAGCGNGYMSKLFSKKVAPSGRVYAMDSDEYFLEVLKQETQGTNIITIKGDITRPTELNESSADLIYVSTVIHGFSKKHMQGFLREAKRILRPGATLAIVEIEKKETPFGPPLELRYSPEELREAVSMAPADTVQAGEHFYMQLFKNRERQESR